MKSYPTIPGGIRRGVPLYVFDKLDGSNVRAEWTRRQGITKFGKRNGLLDDETPYLIEAKDLILEIEDDLARICRAQRWDKVTAFFEFHGENSYGGWHADEPHRVTLIDVNVDRKGFLEPKDFVRLFEGKVDTARLLHTGNWTTEMAHAVSRGELEGMTFEGVVAKGAWDKKLGKPYMGKWKNIAWFHRRAEMALERQLSAMAHDDATLMAEIERVL